MYLPYQPTKEIKKGNRGAVIPGTCFDQPYYHSKGVMWFHHRRQSRCCQSNKVSCNVWRSGARKEGWLQVNRTRDDGLGQLFPSEIVRQKVEVPGCDRQKIEIDKGKPRTKEIRVFTDEGTRGQVFRIGWPPPNFPDPYMLCASNHCQMDTRISGLSSILRLSCGACHGKFVTQARAHRPSTGNWIWQRVESRTSDRGY